MQPRRLRNQARYAREIRGSAEAWQRRDAAPGRAHERRRGHRGTGDGDPCLASASDRLTGRTARPCPARLPLKRHRAPRGSRATSSASGLAQPFASGASFGLTESIHRRRPPAPQRYRLSVPPSAARRMSLQAYFPIRHLPPRLRAWNSPPVPPRTPTLRRGAIGGACRLTAIWLVAACRRPASGWAGRRDKSRPYESPRRLRGTVRHICTFPPNRPAAGRRSLLAFHHPHGLALAARDTARRLEVDVRVQR
jgi:hypothetical protein